MVTPFEVLFPALQPLSYQVTSPTDTAYNCIAWAAGDTQTWWWPDPDGLAYWPAGASRTETVAAFVTALGSLGYSPCAGGQLEPGFEKVALFADAQGRPRHAARQLPDGRWTSKMGELEDIAHGLHDLAGSVYGAVIQVLKRPAAAAQGRQPG
jgi:hypothetical protein